MWWISYASQLFDNSTSKKCRNSYGKSTRNYIASTIYKQSGWLDVQLFFKAWTSDECALAKVLKNSLNCVAFDCIFRNIGAALVYAETSFRANRSRFYFVFEVFFLNTDTLNKNNLHLPKERNRVRSIKNI